jgi:hypothetical protein
MRPTLAALLLMVASFAFAQSKPPAAQTAFSQTFGEAWFNTYWRYNPSFGIQVGTYRHAARLPAPTAAYRAEYLRYLDQTLARLQRTQPRNASERSDRALLKTQLEAERWALTDYRSWQWNPAEYNVAEGFALLLNTPYAPLPQRLRTVGQRLTQVPAFYEAAAANLLHPTREHTALAIQQNAGALEVLGDDLVKQVTASALTSKEKALFEQRRLTSSPS